MKKSRKVPGFVKEPQIQYLEQLLEEIQRGLLQVPRFQRPFIWEIEQRLELFRSIRDGIPIGTIMVWRTTKRVATYNNLGPHRLEDITGTDEPVRQYILDGVQRLSALFGALIPMKAKKASGDDADPTTEADFSVAFNFATGDFELGATSQKSKLLPMSLVLNSVELLKFQRSLEGPNAESMIERSDEVARAFREYKVPIIPIATDELALATRTFQRINSQGTVMSELHMLNALSWSPNFDLLTRIDELRDEHLVPRGWGDLDDDVIVKTCKAALEFDIYESNNVDELSKSIGGVLETVFESLAKAAKFFNDECDIAEPLMVPYSLQIVLIAEAIRIKRGLTKSLKAQLGTWFWLTTYAELFASMSGGRLQHVVDCLRDDVKSKQMTWPGRTPFRRRPIPPRFDFRGARIKALAFRLAEAFPRDAQGEQMEGARWVNEAGTHALGQLVPRNKVGNVLFASAGNRFLCDPERWSELRDLMLNGNPSDEILRSHLVSDEAALLLRNKQYPEFIHARLRDLNEIEDEFVAPLQAQIAP